MDCWRKFLPHGTLLQQRACYSFEDGYVCDIQVVSQDLD